MAETHSSPSRKSDPPGSSDGVESGETAKGVSDEKKRYTRAEMEALRFAVDIEEQRMWWNGVYEELGDAVGQEYDGLCAERKKKQTRKGRKKAGVLIGGEVNTADKCKGSDVLDLGTDSSEAFDVLDNVEGHDYRAFDEPSIDDNSDDDYSSIQRPAFLVEGDPDFDSGPPQDGLEYLRRVRWEAAQIPKVKVARVQSGKQINDQTPYMPKIPEIPKAPLNLLPSKHWEDSFLSDFSDLRQAFCQLESSYDPPSVPQGKSSKDPDASTLAARPLPTLSFIRKMDFVSRAATLRNYISMFESATVLSWDDCLWLFALSAVVDTPFDADTSASLRCLLRKCSDLLAMKSEHDDEVAMLNILITISGKFFGQSENK